MNQIKIVTKEEFMLRMGKRNRMGATSNLSTWDDIFPQSFYDDFKRSDTLIELIHQISRIPWWNKL